LTRPVGPNGQISWLQQIEVRLDLPAAIDAPMPDTCIYLFKGGTDFDDPGGKCVPVSFSRIPTRSILLASAEDDQRPFWQTLREDTATNALGDSESAGSLLLQLSVLPAQPQDKPNSLGGYESEDIVRQRASWTALLASLQPETAKLVPFELRVHVYQVRCLGRRWGRVLCLLLLCVLTGIAS
jgi:hypothetical protein